MTERCQRSSTGSSPVSRTPANTEGVAVTIRPETTGKLLFFQQLLLGLAIVALMWFSYSLYDINKKAADREERIQRQSVLITRCTLVETLTAINAVAKDLGIRIIILLPDVGGVDCRALLNQGTL